MADAPHAGRIGKGYARYYIDTDAVRSLSDTPTEGDDLDSLSGVGSISIQAEGWGIRITNDGSTPDATNNNGFLLDPASSLSEWKDYPGDPSKLRFCRDPVGNTPTLHVFYWGL